MDEKWPSKMQNRFADTKLALHGTTEVIRRDGSSSLKNNILSAVDMLSGSWAGNYAYFLCRNVVFWKGCTNFKSLVFIFLTPTKAIAWHMQNFSSIHRLDQNVQRAQGFGP